MIPPFDIFRLEKDPLEKDLSILWIAAASTLEEARSHIRAARKPGRYVIRSVQTGRKEYVMLEANRSAAAGG